MIRFLTIISQCWHLVNAMFLAETSPCTTSKAIKSTSPCLTLPAAARLLTLVVSDSTPPPCQIVLLVPTNNQFGMLYMAHPGQVFGVVCVTPKDQRRYIPLYLPLEATIWFQSGRLWQSVGLKISLIQWYGWNRVYISASIPDDEIVPPSYANNS